MRPGGIILRVHSHFTPRAANRNSRVLCIDFSYVRGLTLGVMCGCMVLKNSERRISQELGVKITWTS